MSNESKKCLVIGANGFVGSHIVDALASAGHEVIAFDRFSKPVQYVERPNVVKHKGDFNDESSLVAVLNGVDYVFHCFSATTPYSSDNDPISDVQQNLVPSINIFNLCTQTSVKKVIFISSGGAIYGQLAEEKPASETDAATPVSPYGINKLAIEGYLAYFKRKHGLDYVVYRLSNPYGPRQITKNNQGVIPTFIDKMRHNDDLMVIGDGESSRDYIYIGDATDMIVQTFETASANIYNIGRGEQSSVNDIIAALQTLIQTDSKIVNIEEPKTFLKHAGISIDRFIAEFGERSFKSLPQGLQDTLEASNDASKEQ